MLCEHFPICKLTDLQDASNLKKNLRIISQQRCCWLREEVVVAKEGQDGDDDGDDDYSPSEGDINGLGDKSERQEEEETVPTRTKKKAANAVPKTKPSKAASKAKKPRKPRTGRVAWKGRKRRGMRLLKPRVSNLQQRKWRVPARMQQRAKNWKPAGRPQRRSAQHTVEVGNVPERQLSVDLNTNPVAVIRNLEAVLPPPQNDVYHLLVTDRFYTSVQLAFQL
ncbi:hypothetical protein PC119_g22732 [Phytophthora cactorum]|nr:hypothetical protein PC119_g22732 [Phytophthora cactorum]